MGFPHRKLLECTLCLEEPSSCSSDKHCDDCITRCYYPPPSPPPPPPPLNHTINHNISTYLIISFSIAASVFILLCCYAIYVKFFSPSTTNNTSRRFRALFTRQQTQDHDFVVNNNDDDHHHHVVDHPIWYIRTPGLQQSIINAITVCKYKKGEGLIDGTDCSVCLSEFEQDESLRLLPKCNHAFHLPCIDTWLASHTNCPMCRAPIVVDPLRIPSMNPNNVFGSSSVESVRIEVLENSGETETETTASGIEIGMVDSVDVAQLEDDGRRVSEGESSGLELMNLQPRRSVSLDSSSAAKINLALSTVLSSPVESHQVGELDDQFGSMRVVDGNGDLEILNSSAPSSMKRSRSFNAKHLLLPRNSPSQKKSNGPVRSF